MTSYQRELQARIRAIHAAANPPAETAPTPDLLETTLRLLPSCRETRASK